MSDPGPHPQKPRARSGVVVPEQPRWHGRLAARILHTLVLGLDASIRWDLRDDSGFMAPGCTDRVIFTTWHNRLALTLPIYWRASRGHTVPRRLATLVSASRDGGLLAHTLTLLGAEPVRGSSSRRGAQALRELLAATHRGCDIALTPDGPRGPKYHAQEGAILAAQLSGLPLIPVGCRLDWHRALGSWDSFQVPLPFTRCQIRFGARLLVPRETDAGGREELRVELERRLRELNPD